MLSLFLERENDVSALSSEPGVLFVEIATRLLDIERRPQVLRDGTAVFGHETAQLFQVTHILGLVEDSIQFV
jgi:hypothetical protein